MRNECDRDRMKNKGRQPGARKKMEEREGKKKIRKRGRDAGKKCTNTSNQRQAQGRLSWKNVLCRRISEKEEPENKRKQEGSLRRGEGGKRRLSKERNKNQFKTYILI